MKKGDGQLKKYDVIVIGAGPGGYASAIRAAQLGKNVAIVEKDRTGGTCLNVGCIPSKALLHFGKTMETFKKAQQWGFKTSSISVDFEQLMGQKNNVVKTLTSGIDFLLKKNKVTFYQGEAEIADDLIVKIGDKKIKGNDILLATGSKPFVPKIKGLEATDFMTTDTFFNMKNQPDTLCIIGGGVISVELATAMAALGTKVTIIEIANDILLTEDPEARKTVKDQMIKQGIEIFSGAEINEVKQGKILLARDKVVSFDALLVATGRKPVVKLAQDMNLAMDESNRFVKVNHFYETSHSHVYAVGDLIGGYQLAHAAIAEGIAAVQAMDGVKKHVNQTEIPRCVYTFPEIASIGMDETTAKEAGYDVQISYSNLSSNGKALADDEAIGFLKIISEKKYQEILGAVVVGDNATELIGSIAGVKHAEGTVTELANTIWPHPTMSEIIGEGANALYDQAIHM